MKTRFLLAGASMLLAATSIKAAESTKVPADGYPAFALGADVSWTHYIEANDLHKYYKTSRVTASNATNVTDMLTDYGIDAVRLRVWVDPTGTLAKDGFKFKVDGATHEEMGTLGTCTVDEMTAEAARYAARGHRIMVVFQMSDTWADPGAQFIPASWSGCTTVEQLADKAVEHVTEVLTRLHDANVNVAWVQIGNETDNGMLAWPMVANSGEAVSVAPFGCKIAQDASNVPSATVYNFVKVFNACAEASRSIYPEAKTVLHLANSTKWTTVNWVLNLLKRAGFSSDYCDYVGLSLYPGISDGQSDYTAKWPDYASQAITTISNVKKYYGYRTLLCEIGMNNEWSLSGAHNTQAECIAQCNIDVAAFTQYLIDNLATESSTCDGLFYWEPETDYMQGYTKGACVSATPGSSWPRKNVTANAWWSTVQSASTFPAGGLVDFEFTGVENLVDDADASTEYFDLRGIRIASPSAGQLLIEKRGNGSSHLIINK